MKKDLGACALRAGCSLAVSHSPMIFFTCSETVQKYPQNGSKRFCAPKLQSGKRETKAAAEEEKKLSGEREGVLPTTSGWNQKATQLSRYQQVRYRVCEARVISAKNSEKLSGKIANQDLDIQDDLFFQPFK